MHKYQQASAKDTDNITQYEAVVVYRINTYSWSIILTLLRHILGHQRIASNCRTSRPQQHWSAKDLLDKKLNNDISTIM